MKTDNAYNNATARKAAVRRRKMAALRGKGLTLAEIGRRFGGISRVRVWQILNRGA